MKKVFFDTNFLLRFYLADIPSQALSAKKMVTSAIDGSLLLVTDLIVICEMVWVMDSYYKLEKKEITEKISNLYKTPGIIVLNGEILPNAISFYLEKNVDFTDAVIAASAIKHNIEYLASFDKKHMGRFADSGLKRVERPKEVNIPGK
ncbi:MAG: type II toxin-antitoxin system VapC family toxin [Desulfobacterales bacterium]|nr:type II toxin-antitoxin system VapC family toxin [Desulfobacterales bacterium]